MSTSVVSPAGLTQLKKSGYRRYLVQETAGGGHRAKAALPEFVLVFPSPPEFDVSSQIHAAK
jgi:hypothetical protein